MSIVVARTFGIRAAAATVIDYLSDFEHTMQWDPATRRTDRIDSGPIGVGSSWHNETRMLGVAAELTYTLCAATADRLVFVGRNETATATGTITVRPTRTGCTVNYHLELEMHGVAKLASPVVRIEIERLGTETATRLAALLDAPMAHEI